MSNTVQTDETLSAEVLTFAQAHNLVDYVDRAVKATRDVFTEAERIEISLKRDPEFKNLYIEINAVVSDSPELEAEKYSACSAKWALIIPPEVGEMIHLSTSWAS
jgi:hypothetical protein